ncbi:MAG: glycosyl hydrolase family 28-related protein [Shewanella sp.]
MSSQDLSNAIKSINDSASRTNATTDFFNRVLDGGLTESVQNPLTGAVVPSVQKAVYDQYKNDINQIHQDVVDSNEAADRAESAANAVWNRRTVYAEVNASFSDYQDEGRTLTPRLSFDGSNYLPMFDSSTPVRFTGVPSKNNDGTITVATDKGDSRFSRVDAEAVARKDAAPIVNAYNGVVNAKEFGLSETATSADNTAAITKAFNASSSGVVFVPAGTYKLTNPHDLPFTLQMYGDGKLVFDNAQLWRKGGSSGSVDVPEKYTLMYSFSSRNDVSVTFDNVAQAIEWVGDRTVKTAGPPATAAVRINIANGWVKLSSTPIMITSFNTMSGSMSEKLSPTLPDPTINPRGFNNTGYGISTLLDLENGGNNTAFGSRVLTSVKSGENNTAMGFQAAYRTTGTGNTAIGSIALEHLVNGDQNTAVGLAAAGQLIDGTGNTSLGFDALGEAISTKHSVCVGYRAQGNTGPTSSENGVYVGAFSGDFCLSSQNVAIGYRSLNCEGRTNNNQNHATENTSVGSFTLRKLDSGSQNVVMGAGAASAVERANRGVVIGFEAGSISENLASYNVLIGYRAGQKVSGDGNVFIGNNIAADNTTGKSNVGVGAGALATNVSGELNTCVGVNAGRLTTTGQQTVNLTNTAALGNDARVSDSNQVQLGNSTTTTYVYGTVQNRSDARDKTDVENTALGIDFIMGLRPVDGRWDMRDDYFEEVEVMSEDGEMTTQLVPLAKDGSKARNRKHHWFIAQEVKALCDKMGVEFGGYQDHKVNGGCDVLSLGYDEFIPPTVKAVQDCWKRMDELEARLAKLEG